MVTTRAPCPPGRSFEAARERGPREMAAASPHGEGTESGLQGLSRPSPGRQGCAPEATEPLPAGAPARRTHRILTIFRSGLMVSPSSSRARGARPRPAPPPEGLPRPPPAPPAAMEFVYVVPREAVFPDCYPHGLVPFAAPGTPGITAQGFEAILVREGFFVERDRAERTPAWKQVIPYSVVVSGERVMLVRRTRSGGDARLHDKLSIGIGGHVNPEDLDGAREASPIDAGTRRELDEELGVRGEYEIRRIGLINDDSNPVGAVHVGVVQRIALEAPVEVRERNRLEGRLVTLDEIERLHAGGADFETWSKLLVERLGELLPNPFVVRS